MPRIDGVKYGEISVNNKIYYSDLVVWWDSKPSLLMKTHLFDLDLLKVILKKKPESIVVGIGLEGTVKILPQVREQLAKKKISLFVDKTLNAMEIYNAMLGQGKKVIAVMHVTL